eukprot:g1723.t1 g1723   contig10:2667584-2669463(+)
MTVQTVTQSSFTFQSDIPPTSVDIHPSGILHAHRTTSPNTINNTNNNTREEHTFAWIFSLSHIQSAATHLTQHGFDPITFVFIPYSTKRNWVNRYPHAAPALECNENGEVVVFLNWRPYPNGLQEIKDEDGIFARGSSGSKKRSSSKSPANNNRNKKRKFGVELTPNSILSNPERDMLHLNIYTYFQWLQSQLVEMETTFSGKKFLGNACARVDDLGRCLGVLKETFKVIGPNVEEMFGGGGQGDFAVAAAAAGGGVTTPAKKVTLEKVMGGDEAPLLEKVLGGDLSHQIEQLGKPLQEGSHTREQGDFEEYFQKLERFKEEKGHVNVPTKYKEDVKLGKWVSNIRQKKKGLDSKGMEEATPKIKRDRSGNMGAITLTKGRIERLENLGFQWNLTGSTPRMSWEGRFQECMDYYEEHNKWPPHSHGTLGEWVHKQRCKWAKRDPVFMEKQYPRLQAIGFLWKVKDRNNTSWEEGYAQLEGFFQLNGHLNIQPPILGDGNEQNEYQHAYEMKGQSDLHRWIQRVRMDYKMFQAGKETKLLNGERVLQLIKLGFEFN